MSKYLERAKALRNDPNVHYNCAQAVLMAFCEEKGLSSQMAADLTANFGSGMRIGGVCGAMSGGLLVLGLYGQCRDLLRVNAEKGAPKKQHCDNMVYEAVRLTENLLRDAGKIA